MWLINAILIIVAIVVISQVITEHGGEIASNIGLLVFNIFFVFFHIFQALLALGFLGGFLALILQVAGAPPEVTKAIAFSENNQKIYFIAGAILGVWAFFSSAD